MPYISIYEESGDNNEVSSEQRAIIYKGPAGMQEILKTESGLHGIGQALDGKRGILECSVETGQSAHVVYKTVAFFVDFLEQVTRYSILEFCCN